ncbi:MAG: hypothetical protein LDL26_12085 [Caenispirillum bisanense]|nr:hypothetical protein [Caenispirillum bisanense]MCA1974843.1 hypothetical protein [Caenispirillum sp.]
MMTKKTPPTPNGTLGVAQAAVDVVTACAELARVVKEENTKRIEICAKRDVLVEKIQADRTVLVEFLTRSFEQQGKALDGLFERLDTALAANDPDLVGPILASIVETVKTSPLGDMQTLDQRMKDNTFAFVLGKA